MAKRAMTIQECRAHKALLWRNIRKSERDGWVEHAETLRRVFAPMLQLKLERVPRPIRK